MSCLQRAIVYRIRVELAEFEGGGLKTGEVVLTLECSVMMR